MVSMSELTSMIPFKKSSMSAACSNNTVRHSY
eukprot:COSAG03_NODE_9920_length_685_cov_13.829352_2_plen_31_part_01